MNKFTYKIPVSNNKEPVIDIDFDNLTCKNCLMIGVEQIDKLKVKCRWCNAEYELNVMPFSN